MKKLLMVLVFLVTLACITGCEEPKQVYESEVKTYKISSKDSYRTYHALYLQTPTSTECVQVNGQTFNKYEVGQEIQVLIKYWEKPKNK